VARALASQDLDNDTFVLEHFWRAQFDHSKSNIPIEVFNQAFYSFFHQTNNLLPVKAVEEILNECFSYMVKKNKNHISKRHLKKVIKRHFPNVFQEIFKLPLLE